MLSMILAAAPLAALGAAIGAGIAAIAAGIGIGKIGEAAMEHCRGEISLWKLSHVNQKQQAIFVVT